MKYTRNNPSQRYLHLIEQYKDLHINGERNLNLSPEKTFSGLSLPVQANRIKKLIEKTNTTTILDYGSGKGHQYEVEIVEIVGQTEKETISDFWDVDSVHCYDPCYTPFITLPSEKFDGVICTDVLEHCPEEDIPWIINELFSYANKFVFANVACYPASKHLPNGENAHCTIQPLAWWQGIIETASLNYSDITWEIWVQQHENTSEGIRLIEEKITNQNT